MTSRTYPSEEAAKRAEIEVQILGLELKLGAQLLHALVEFHERCPEAFDLLSGQPAGVDAPQRLALHQLAQQLDDREHQLAEALRDVNRPRPGARRGQFCDTRAERIDTVAIAVARNASTSSASPRYARLSTISPV
jgi:hypothetical protein